MLNESCYNKGGIVATHLAWCTCELNPSTSICGDHPFARWMNNHHMGYWLDATFLSKLMPILTPKDMGHTKKPFIGFSWVQDYLSIHDIVCPHTTSCF